MSERPDTAALLTEVGDFVRRYVVLRNDYFYDAVALWVLQAHAIAAFDTSPRLLFKSPEKESGKTRALEVLETITPNPLFVMNATIAAIFRLLAIEQITLLFDEGDAIFSPKAAAQHEDLRALLNTGYRRGADVARVVGEGRKMAVKRFKVFAATALAAIGNLPDTIESRSIIIPMRRRAPDEPVAQFRRRAVEFEAGNLRAALAEWAVTYVGILGEAEPAMPEGVTDRAADCWESLLAIADLAAGDWPRRARDAAQAVVAGRVADDQSTGVRLLVDVKAVLNGYDRISSAGLLTKLNALEESGWGGWHDGKGLTARDLAGRLKAYGIRPRGVRLSDGSTPNGFQREDFVDAFARYLRDGSTRSTKVHGDSYSKDGVVDSVDEREREEEEEEGSDSQQRLPFVAQTGSTSSTRSTPYSKPVEDRGVNGSGPPHDDELLEDEDYLAAVVDGADVEAILEETAAQVAEVMP
jgi:Protein of unknown function (DUF3631)